MAIIPAPVRSLFSRRPSAALADSKSDVQNVVYENPAIPSEDLPKLDPFTAHGATGTLFFSGIISGEEYNHDLDGDLGLRAFDKMWRSDGEVSALLQVLMLPLLEATWSIEAGADDEQSVAIAQFVQDNLFGGMQQTWQETLSFILLEWLRDGFAVMEKVFAEDGQDDGRIRLRKLAPRLSKTIYRWYPNQDDELDRIQQRVYVPDKTGMVGQYRYPIIPASKLVVFTNQQEGNNWRGVSVLRAAYKHWYIKDQLERIAAIAAERMAVGIPVWTEPPVVTQAEDRTKAMAVGASLHAHEMAVITEPGGWAFRFESPKGGMDLLPLIEYHSLQIVRSVLAQFLNLDRGGSYALSMDISSFFLQALHARARYVCDKFNSKVIRPLVDLNFTVDRYPTLKVDDLDRRDIDKYMAGLGRILSANWITKNVDTENAIRSLLNLPDLPPDATPAGGGQPSVDTDSEGQAAVEPGSDEDVSSEGVDLPEAGEAPSQVQLGHFEPELYQAVQVLLAEAPPQGIAPRRWRRAVLRRARILRRSGGGDVTVLASDIADKGAAWFVAGADGQIHWGEHGDFEECVAVAGKYMDDPEGYCNERHQDAVGGPPGSEGKG